MPRIRFTYNNAISQLKILEQNQIRSDHIFTIFIFSLFKYYFKNIIGPLYVCFVDFKKVFDSVDHKLILQQLVTYGIKEKFLKVITSLYDRVISCVRGNDSLTDIVPCNRGVRQGYFLGPVLFALYFNDSNRHIKHTCSLPFTCRRVCFISTGREDFQSQLDALDTYSKSFKMEVNLDKTKVMLLQKQKSRAKSTKNKLWIIGDKEIKECVS